jgi:hypothetical protein
LVRCRPLRRSWRSSSPWRSRSIRVAFSSKGNIRANHLAIPCGMGLLGGDHARTQQVHKNGRADAQPTEKPTRSPRTRHRRYLSHSYGPVALQERSRRFGAFRYLPGPELGYRIPLPSRLQRPLIHDGII